MRKELIVGVGAALALAAFSATDASACGRRSAPCGGYAPPVAYPYAPGYGYVPPAPIYGYGPPPVAYPPAEAVDYHYARAAYGAYGFYGDGAYGHRGWRGCHHGYGPSYGYAPPVAYEGYRPAAVWWPAR